MADNVLRFEFLATDHFTPTANRVSEKLAGMGRGIGSLGKTAALAIGSVGVGAIAAFGYEMVKGVKAATEYQTLQLKTAAVIKSTGNVAHLSVAGIDALAARLESMSGVDETLIVNSENVLATFTNIRNSAGKNNDIYNQATGSILDLSVAMGEDLQTATVQVGKALNDPVKGMTALQRVGVTFNSTQKDTIKHLVASGNVMGAQKIILGELNKEFGGAAKAAGHGFGGAMARVKDVIDDTFRDLAIGLLPVLTKAANWFADKLPMALSATGTALKVVGRFLATIGKNFALPILRLYLTYWAWIGKQFIAILPTIINLGKVIGGYLATGVGILVHYFRDMLLPALRDAGNKVFPAIKNAIATVGAAFRDHMDVIRAFGQVFLFVLKAIGVALAVLGLLLVKVVIPVIAKLLTVVLAVVGPIIRALLSITGALITVITGISSLTVKVAKAVASIIVAIMAPWVNAGKFLFSAGVKIVTGLINGWASFRTAVANAVSGFIAKFIIGPFAGAVKWLVTSGKDILVGLIRGYVGFWTTVSKTVAQFVARFIVAPFAGAVKWLVNAGRNILVGLIRGNVSFWGNVARTVANFISRYLIAPYARAITWLVARGAQILAGLVNGIRSRFSAVTGAIGNIIARVRGAFSNAARWLFNAGYNVLWGFWNGLRAIWNKVTGWISGIASWIRNHKGPISLDSRLLIPAGRAIMQGFLNGLKSGAGAAWSFVKSVGGKTVAELQSILGGVSSALGASGNMRVQGGGNSANRQMGQRMAAYYGWTGNQWAALNNLWMGESGWNNFARNPSSGAFGIPQALPPGKMGAAAAGGNAAAQIAWGLSYIKSVYGSPANAYGKWLARSPHWYDTGGYARGEGWFRKGPAPERILSPRQTKWFEGAMMSAGRSSGHRSGGLTVILNAPNYVGNRNELIEEFNRFARQGRLDAIVRMASR